MGKSLFPLEMFEKYFTQVCKEQNSITGNKNYEKKIWTHLDWKLILHFEISKFIKNNDMNESNLEAS